MMGWQLKPDHVFNPTCKILVTKRLPEVFSEYQPEPGKIYDAEFCKGKKKMSEFCVIEVKDKRIVVRHGEFVIVG